MEIVTKDTNTKKNLPQAQHQGLYLIEFVQLHLSLSYQPETPKNTLVNGMG